jgi:hypothetical protein
MQENGSFVNGCPHPAAPRCPPLWQRWRRRRRGSPPQRASCAHLQPNAPFRGAEVSVAVVACYGRVY